MIYILLIVFFTISSFLSYQYLDAKDVLNCGIFCFNSNKTTQTKNNSGMIMIGLVYFFGSLFYVFIFIYLLGKVFFFIFHFFMIVCLFVVVLLYRPNDEMNDKEALLRKEDHIYSPISTPADFEDQPLLQGSFIFMSLFKCF